MPQHSLPTRIAGVAVAPDDEDRLLEPRVEAGQVRQVRAVLAVGVDDEAVVAALRHPLAEAIEAGRRSSAGGSSGDRRGMPKSGRATSARRASASVSSSL